VRTNELEARFTDRVLLVPHPTEILSLRALKGAFGALGDRIAVASVLCDCAIAPSEACSDMETARSRLTVAGPVPA
jgi:hypothetical protein